ncbi:helix-turn-helix domain-containing protein [Pseudomonas frederiksbergensis]|uniref:Helix-turn-helix domain-containing protein n=1 Tax=Pseudomonas frederiksbergensis TaxID=104087 RepID=A0A423KIK3_9PSED|nr:helix-turn-helix domain-containing protein [Pseudomonas frederiksbergensis]RON52985.1 helix-turn-helix domain-containing protein [Pseudomonas frederiksbergensis]
MSWALSLPVQALKDSSARHVLLCLANYAGSNGAGAFPSASTLAQDTGLSERTVRYKLDDLEKSGLIQKGNQAIAAVHIDRHDRRPVVYDLQLLRGANTAPRSKRGADDATGCNLQQNGVQPGTERGAEAAPNTSINHQVTEEQQQRDLADEIVRQDQTAGTVPDDRQRFAMFATWSPNEKALADQLAIAGFPGDSVSVELLAGFKGFFVAKGSTVDSAAGWCFRLVGWVKRERVKAAGTATSGAPDDYNDEDIEWMHGDSK